MVSLSKLENWRIDSYQSQHVWQSTDVQCTFVEKCDIINSIEETKKIEIL